MANDREEDTNTPSRFSDEEHHGWSPDVGTGGSERAKEANEKAFDGPPPGKGSGREESEEERSGVAPTDTSAETPLNVGTSTTTRAEEHAEDGEGNREGTKGPSERPYGTSHDEEETGV